MNLYLCQRCGKLHEDAGVARPTGAGIKKCNCVGCGRKAWCGPYRRCVTASQQKGQA